MQPATIELGVLMAILGVAYFIFSRIGRRSLFWRRLLDTVIPFLMGLAGFAGFITGAVP
jgi:uncharacterized membrane protein HdeD (DUF308 family)